MILISQFQQTLQSGRDHWLFWPLMILLVQIAVYNTIFAETGYLAYREKEKELAKLRLESDELKARRELLQASLGELSDDDTAFSRFSREHYLYDQKVKIIKFIKHDQTAEKPAKKTMNIEYAGRLYILFCSIALFAVTGLFWKANQRRMENEI